MQSLACRILTAYETPLDNHYIQICASASMTFRDVVVDNKFLFILGQPAHTSSILHNGVVTYYLTRYGCDDAAKV